MQKMTKPAMDKVKKGPKSHNKGPERSLKSIGIHAPLIGQKLKQTKQKERGSPPSSFRPQNHMPTTKNALDFSG